MQLFINEFGHGFATSSTPFEGSEVMRLDERQLWEYSPTATWDRVVAGEMLVRIGGITELKPRQAAWVRRLYGKWDILKLKRIYTPEQLDQIVSIALKFS